MEFMWLLRLSVVMAILGTGSSLGNSCWNSRDFDIMPGETCFSFIFCYYGYPINKGWCYRGSAFDAELKQCTTKAYEVCMSRRDSLSSPIAKFSCPVDVSEGFYPDYSKGCPTKQFYKCRRGAVQSMTCETDLVFNEGTDKCDNATNIPCGAILVCPPSLQYGVYADYTNGCPPNRFIRCFGGSGGESIKLEYTCPDGLFYNEGIKTCDYSKNVPCLDNKKE
ncbi:uncharacterized protein [Haliotis cracherodii]|uniref:uncharacterized protein n=1 Tax=Haliotis cracherodii TaxID=6455 RepID=UPI0039EADFFA